MSRGEAGLSLSVYVALTYIPVGGLLCVFCERGLLFFVCRSAFTPPRTDLPWLVGLYGRSEVYAFFLSLFLGTLEMVCPHSSRARSFVSCHWRAVTSPVAVARKFRPASKIEVSFRHSFVGSDRFRSQAGRNGEDSYVDRLSCERVRCGSWSAFALSRRHAVRERRVSISLLSAELAAPPASPLDVALPLCHRRERLHPRRRRRTTGPRCHAEPLLGGLARRCGAADGHVRRPDRKDGVCCWRG